jgi:hypothetical protein
LNLRLRCAGRRPVIVRFALIASVACFAGSAIVPNGGAVAPSSAIGRVGLGVLGDSGRFESLTGQQSTTRLLIAAWGATNFDQLFAMMGARPMLGINPESSISPGAIARGAGDAYLAALNQAVAKFGRPIYIRPMAEMNGHWNPYCAYDAGGAARGPDDSTASFRKAFARIYVAVHGGPGVASALRRLGLPAFRGGPLAANAQALVVWNPQGYGSPDLPGNRAEAYYPGDRYVDVVGDDLYYIRGKAEWAAAEALYQAHPTKPFAFPEWGLWGLDAPKFVSDMAQFVRTHLRTKLIVYYNGRPGSVFDLQAKPASRGVYRRLILPLSR